MAGVVQLRFRMFHSKVGIRAGEVKRILGEDHCVYLRHVDPDLGEWLDAHAPDWGVEHRAGGYYGRELPIGEDEFGTFIEHDRFLTFTRRQHAEACERYLREVTERRERLRTERSGLRPEICDRCSECHGPLEDGSTRLEFRCGPVVFSSEIACQQCPECGEETCLLSDDGFSDLARDEMAKWIDADAQREACLLPAFAEIEVPCGIEQGAMESLVTPVMRRWIESAANADARPDASDGRNGVVP